MARIRPYEQQVSSQGDLPSRSAQASDFGGTGLVNLGGAVQSVASDAGQIQRFMNEAKAQREVTDAQTQVLRLSNDLTQTIDQRARAWKPGDPYLSEQMPGMIKQQLENLGYTEEGNERYETQAGAGTFQRLSERLQLHMTQTLKSIDGELAGQAAKLNHQQLVDDTGNFVYTHPSYTPLRIAEVTGAILDPRGQYARVPAVERERLARDAQEKIAVNGVQGLIRNYPHRAMEILSDPTLKQDEQYGWIAKYLPNEAHEPLMTKAKERVNALEIERRQAEAEARRQQQELHHATDTNLMAQYERHRQDPKSPNITPTQIADKLDAGELDGRTAAALQNMLDADAASGGRVKPDHALENSLFQRIHLPYGDPRKLTDTAEIYNNFSRLGRESVTYLRKEFEDSRSDEGSKLGADKAAFLEGQRHLIDKSLFGKFADALGSKKFADFRYFVNQEEERMRRENKDPRQLYNPDSSEYLGKHVSRYQTSMEESMKYIQERITGEPGLPKTEGGAVAPDLQRKPGETIDQWRARTGR